MNRKPSSAFTIFSLLYALFTLVYVVALVILTIGAAYIAAHFVSKFW